MKKKSVMLLTVCICLGIVGCGNNVTTDGAATAQKKTEAVTTEAASAEGTEAESEEETSSVQLDQGESAEYVTSIDMVDYSRDVKDDNGVIMLKVTQNCPDITIDGSAAAADNVNDFYLKEKEAFDATVEKYTQMAKDDYAGRSEEEKANFHAYELGLEYTLKRSDDLCISIVKDSYEYTGGAHPNAFREAAVFDTATGEQLTLDDIFEDVDKTKTFFVDYLTEELKDKKYADTLFEDYEKDIPDILTDDNTWYLSKEGYVIICNEYIISPHSSGIMEFTIPYDKVDGFSDMYRPDGNAK